MSRYIVFGDSSFTYDGSTPELEPLGGSHSALVYLARSLARLGNKVRVYNRCERPDTYDGVEYLHWHDLIAHGHNENPDFFISLRDPNIGQYFWKGGGVKILLCQDYIDQPIVHSINGDTNHIVFVSGWQMDEFCHYLHWPRSRGWVAPNGIVSDYFNVDDHFFRDGKKIAYTPTPFRGLEHLLKLFPRIREMVPEAELHLYGGMATYQEDGHRFDKLYRTTIEGVHYHGAIGQRKLAEELEKCRVWAYPNVWLETCCTAAYEAMAAGCVAVASDRGGLSETISWRGELIPGIPGNKEHDDLFVEKCAYYLQDDVQWGLKARQSWAWTLNNRPWFPTMAQHWENLFDLMEG